MTAPVAQGELLVEQPYGYTGAVSAMVDLVYALEAQVVRIPRRRCSLCNQRRVLYRIRVATDAGALRRAHGETEARCATCWGIVSADQQSEG